MYITYDKGIPAKIGLTKISRRTKILVYGTYVNKSLANLLHHLFIKLSRLGPYILSFLRSVIQLLISSFLFIIAKFLQISKNMLYNLFYTPTYWEELHNANIWSIFKLQSMEIQDVLFFSPFIIHADN